MKKILLLAILVLATLVIKAQDATFYVSPHDVDKTLSNLYFSIDKGGFKYLNTRTIRSQNSDNGEFHGRIELVEFEIKDLNKVISCEPTIALEMPMKIMVWEEDEDVYVAYVSPYVFKRRYFIAGCDEILTDINKAMIRIVNDAIRTH